MHPKMQSKLIEVSSRTYNRCTSLLEHKFGFSVDFGHPRQRFETAVDLAFEYLRTACRKKPKTKLTQFSQEEIQAIFLLVARHIANIANTSGEIIEITRVDFVREVVRIMQDHFGFQGGHRLHVDAKRGLYADLKGYIRFLIAEFKGIMDYDGSYPYSSLIFYPTQD